MAITSTPGYTTSDGARFFSYEQADANNPEKAEEA